MFNFSWDDNSFPMDAMYPFSVSFRDPKTPYGSHLQLVPEEASFPRHTPLMWSGSPSHSPSRVGVGASLSFSLMLTSLLLTLVSLDPSLGLYPSPHPCPPTPQAFQFLLSEPRVVVRAGLFLRQKWSF